MKRFPNFALLVLIFLTACGNVPGVSPTDTPAPVPTLTFTPPPTETPTPLPTATLDAIATLKAHQTQQASDVLSELDILLAESDISYKGGRLLWQRDKPIDVSLSGRDTSFTKLDEKLIAGNFILKTDITWSTSGIIVCGVSFRAEPNFKDGKQYKFQFLRFSGLPAWSIDFYEFDRVKNSQTSLKFSGAVEQKNGATNQVVLIAKDEQFTVYINEVRQGRYFDNSIQRADGHFAFLGALDTGKGTCTFENSWIWEIE